MEEKVDSDALSDDRVESLSDLVFGLALSISAIVPVSWVIPKTGSDVISSLIEFGFIFVVPIRVRTRYSKMLGNLPFDTASTRILNLLLLPLVSIEPYLFCPLYGSLGMHSTIGLNLDFTTAINALGLSCLFANLGCMTYLLAQEEPTQHAP